ncbi:hypothetical protein [Winogradskyella marincola]|uniref:Glycosyltransferase n=1 Tax=Winogradskyella marincola TaxID=3037795 RepID=A0ABT6FXH4_9FLAO|nr:hypothetical protein [Winogradskyella sp. YYF002]MDG4714314.1 hypothetical protein [Winogradskyella sp. YYF002]
MIHYLYSYHLNRKRDKKRTKFGRWINWQLYKYLKINLVKYYKNFPLKSLKIDTESAVIVSLTTIPSRIEYVYLPIKSLLNQTVPPKKIVLWLGEEFFTSKIEDLPSTLQELIPLGLEIEFCKDLKAHTKYYYAFKKYPDNLVVTIDDDIIYPKNLIEVLLNKSNEFPKSVVANRVRKIVVDNAGFKSYREWKINTPRSNTPSHFLLATGVSGVLYNPSLFLESIYDTQGMAKTNCIGDDIWLKAAQIHSNIMVVKTDQFNRAFVEISEAQDQSLFKTNVFESANDRQIKEVFTYFNIDEETFTN